ncbi:MAG: RIP metalloprotease RseP [Bacillota bacterium]|nr:RIP metalloprotease RseP [Bacillota bacterium]
MTIIYAVLIFCLLIFVHELGHFITAKACGVKVNEFAIGMGPAFFQKERGETTYSLRIFPIGGFCAMEGEDEDSEDPRAFNNRPAWQKAIVLVAGSLMNVITCIVLLMAVYLVIGTATTTIGSISDGYPAQEAGLQVGDTLVSIDGNQVNSWNDVAEYVPGKEKSTVEVVVDRDGSRLTLDVGTRYNEDSGRYILGIVTKVAHSPAKAITGGFRGTWDLTKFMYKTLKQLFTGEVSAKELSGPVGIVYAVNTTASTGVMNVVYLAALLSLNLAVINMLPFPALDGGRILFLVIRKITGKKVTDKMEGYVHMIGMMCLFALMIYVTFNDVIRFIIPIFS